MTCEECPISLLCLGGQVPEREVFHCDECGQVGFYDAEWRVPETFACANLKQLQSALVCTGRREAGEFKACDACLQRIMNHG